MGLSQSRLTDIGVGVCYCHHHPRDTVGQVITCSPNVFCNSLGVARLTDIVLGDCGHIGELVTGSPTVFANGLSLSRITDHFEGCFVGELVSGSPNTFTGVSGPGGYTEVDYGNLDDEQEVDDGLNIYPPIPTVNGIPTRQPTATERARSASLEVAPQNTVQENTTPPPSAATPPVSCASVTSYPVPDSFVLSPNFTAGSLSTKAVISHYQIKAQQGLTVSDIVCNLQALAENIGEPLKAQYPTMFVTSAFRWGSSVSQHEKGQAMDVQIPGFTNSQYYNAAIWVRDTLPYDQLILEYGGNRPWIHISFNRAGNRPVTAFNKWGTRTSGANYVWGKFLDRV